jgi:hypothetical protein
VIREYDKAESDGDVWPGFLHSAQSNAIPLRGKFRNFNTIEEFRSPELKKQLFSETVQDLINTFSAPNHSSQIPTFNPFLLVSFADLKKYVYHYWFAFPALVQKPAWEIVVPDEDGESGSTAQSGMREWEGDVSHRLHHHICRSLLNTRWRAR